MRSLSFKKLFTVLFCCFAVLFAASALFAWTGPTAAPPNNNVAAPVNVGSVNQVKDAGLSLNGLAVFGNALLSGDAITYLNFGSTALVGGYGIRDNTGTLEFKNKGGSWAPIGGGSTTSSTSTSSGGTSGYTGSFNAPGTPYTQSANNAIYAYGTFAITPTVKFDVVDGLIKSSTVLGGTAVLNSPIRCDPAKQYCGGDSDSKRVATAKLLCTSAGFTYVGYASSFASGAYGKPDSTGSYFITGDQSCTSSCNQVTQVTCSL